MLSSELVSILSGITLSFRLRKFMLMVKSSDEILFQDLSFSLFYQGSFIRTGRDYFCLPSPHWILQMYRNTRLILKFDTLFVNKMFLNVSIACKLLVLLKSSLLSLDINRYQIIQKISPLKTS